MTVPDFRQLFDREYIGAFDLVDAKGKPIDATVTIARVEAKTLTNQKGKTLKPVIWFEGREKGFVANKTNCKTIAGMYGNRTEAWVGKRITLYPTTTSVGGETVECIRVRPEEKGRAA